MNNIVNLLLRASISASLSNREAFVERVSHIIEDQVGKDPESARHLGDNIASAMEGLNEELLIQQLLKPQTDDALNQKIEHLTEMVEKLTTVVEHLASQTVPQNPEER